MSDMGVSFSVPLPGPFRYSKPIGGGKRKSGGGSLLLLPLQIIIWIIVLPFQIAWTGTAAIVRLIHRR